MLSLFIFCYTTALIDGIRGVSHLSSWVTVYKANVTFSYFKRLVYVFHLRFAKIECAPERADLVVISERPPRSGLNSSKSCHHGR